MSNEREWIEHTLSHAHHEPRGDAVVFTWGLRYDSRQCSETTGDPFILSRSNPSFFLPLLSLSLPPSLLFPIVIVQTTMATAVARPDGGGGHHKGHFAHGTFNACVPRVWAVCEAPLSIWREVAFLAVSRCSTRYGFRANPPHRILIPSLGLTRRQISEERGKGFAH